MTDFDKVPGNINDLAYTVEKDLVAAVVGKKFTTDQGVVTVIGLNPGSPVTNSFWVKNDKGETASFTLKKLMASPEGQALRAQVLDKHATDAAPRAELDDSLKTIENKY